tara:strand:+ start:255 stop:425 length:171 start_codon:yes stop_codon:yes gene_type:complete
MKNIILFIFLVSCTAQSLNNKSKVDNLKFNIDFTFDEYKKFLTNFNVNSKYPDISK